MSVFRAHPNNSGPNKLLTSGYSSY